MNEPTPSPPGGTVNLALITMCVIAISSSAILIRVADAPSLAVSMWRSLGGAVVLAPFALRDRRNGYRIGAAQWRDLGLSGALLGAHFGLWIGSLSYTTVASSVTLGTSAPLFVALGEWVFLGERPSRRVWVGLSLSIVGAIVIGLGDLQSAELGRRALFGDALALLGSVAVAGYFLYGRILRTRGMSNVTYSACSFGASALVLLPLCLLTGAQLGGYPTPTWWALFAMVIGPQLLGHAVLNGLLAKMSATVVAIIVLLEPVGATALAIALFTEYPAPLFWLGAPIILAGVLAVISSPSRHQTRQ